MKGELDTKDKRILLELDRNSRQPISTIAKKVGLSKEVVNYRLKRLQERNIVRGFRAVIDVSKIGYKIYRLFIKFRSVTPQKEEEIHTYFNDHPATGWIAEYEGFYDLAILFWAKDVYEFREIYEEVQNKFGTSFQDDFVSIVCTIHHFKHNYLFGSKDYSEAVLGGKNEQVQLDDLDIEILKILAADARETTLEIGRRVNSSPNTVKYRIKKLMDSGVIVAFNCLLDTSVLGYHHYKVFLQLENMNKTIRKKLVEYLRINKNTIYITDAIGLADMEFEIRVKDGLELHNMIKDLKSNFAGIIRDCDPGLVFKEHDINYLPFPSDPKTSSK